MPHCIIKRYVNGNTEEFKIQLPKHVTITGTENHFGLAHHNATMFMRGMIELDDHLSDENKSVKYWLQSVQLD